MAQTADFYPVDGNGLHLGLIPDGGRRWAANQKVSLKKSYQTSGNLISDFLPEFIKNNISELSIYLSSAQNFKREAVEIEAFVDEIKEAISNHLSSLSHQHQISFKIVGRPQSQPGIFDMNAMILNQIETDKAVLKVNLCFQYDPFDELMHAFQASKDPGDLINFLWIQRPLDLVIRSGGANLLSNFLPLQSAYARLYFSDKLFNDLEWNDIFSYIDHYKKLTKKYGE